MENNLHFKNLPDTKDILELMKAGLYWKNIDGIYLGCNEFFAKLAGIGSADEIKGKTDEVLPWRQQAKLLHQHEKAVLMDGKPRKTKEQLLVSDGSTVTLLVSRAPLLNKKNVVIGVISTFIDITKNKEPIGKEEINLNKASSQQKLEFYADLTKEITGCTEHKKSAEDYASYIQNYLEKIIACMPGNVYWLDKNSVFLGCNDNVANMLGLHSRTDIIGMTHAETAKLAHWSAGQAASFEKDDKDVIATGVPKFNVEEPPITDINGREIRFLTSRVPLKDRENNVIGVVGISIDITDRKKAEEDLKTAKERAETADKLKLDFIHNMEHDIRTPFWGLLGFTTELEQEETDPVKKRKLGYCAEGAQELFKYCSYIVDFSKNLEGAYPILSKKFKIREIINKVITMEMPAAQHKNLLLTIDVKEDVPSILVGDPDRLQRIFLSLVGNSIKFTHSGYIKISALLANSVGEQVILKFIIEDTGIGISKENQNYIYEKFTRGTPSNQGIYKGLGLGLYIVKQYTVDMDGEIDVESEAGEGTKFICTIPFELPLLDEALNAKPIRILFVEPNSDLQASQQEILKKLGCSVDGATTGKETLDLFSQNHYDLIFTALTLSDMSGVSLIETLRKNEKNEFKTPIIVMATYEEKDEEKNTQDVGANEFMAKPLRRERFEKMLGKYISRFELKGEL